MNTNATTSSRPAKSAKTDFRNPHYDCQHDDQSMTLMVYVPGVAASGVDITVHGPDLIITARKERFVRPNWTSLQLERAQRDYMLRLRIGYGYEAAAMTAVMENGVLTITLPKRAPVIVRPAEALAIAV